MLTHEDVEDILRVLDATPVDELALETERFKLTLRRAPGGRGGWTQEHETRSAPNLVAAAPPAGPVPPPAAAAPPPTRADATEIRAPLVGTFYRAPKPGAAPFVDVGTLVTAETVVAIVETMKLMNSVYAGAHGRVIEICVTDGQFIEQHQVLMRLVPPDA
jgi:acetyl-CoA carboxylase biotin carboxyl carrier protein